MRSCCDGCKTIDMYQKYGSVVSKSSNSHTWDADPILGNNAIHWVLSKECYSSTRRPYIEEWVLMFEQSDLIVYKNNEFCIAAFRGSTTSGDIKNDIQLSKPGGSCSFDKVAPSIEIIKEILNDDDIIIQLTGHSLGGAIARCVGTALQLGVVTFNPAAPPSSIASIGPNQIHYHIVFDIISAWTIATRIDKKYRPHNTRISKYFLGLPFVPTYILYNTIQPLLKAHEIDSFSYNINGKIVSSEYENSLWQNWFEHLPYLFQKTFLSFTGTKELPVIPG